MRACAPSRSALFTTKMSATSMSPAFMACTESPDADRLDEDPGKARGVHELDHVARGRGKAAQATARGHAANEHVLVQRVGLHADAVAEHGATREGARWIHGDDGHALPVRAEP